MEVSRDLIRMFTIVCGLVVLLSYIYGISKMEEPTKLWGGIPESWQSYIVPFMFVAAIGYLIYWWIALFQIEQMTLNALNWPWANGDDGGMKKLALAYLLILIPSSLWLESTNFHMSNSYSWTPILVVGTLFLVAIGNIMLGLLAYDAYLDGIEGSGWMIIGSLMLALQCIVNDLLIWSLKFPW